MESLVFPQHLELTKFTGDVPGKLGPVANSMDRDHGDGPWEPVFWV